VTTDKISHRPNSYGRIIVGLYFFSGVTALAYEVLWARMLSLQFGVSIFGVIVTVAAFMLGLGAGSLLLSRLRFTKSLLIFAGLEFSVALFALFLPSIMSALDSLIAQIASNGGLSLWYGIQSISITLVLFFPACALGATFPLVLHALRDTSIRAGMVYGVNSVGGALGAILPLLLLPLLGWINSVTLIACIGFCVSLSALILYVRHRSIGLGNNRKRQFQNTATPIDSDINPPSATIVNKQNPQSNDLFLLRSYWAYAGIGLAALTLEISWTRLFGMILLRTEYVMAIILSIFLLGIAIGSVVGTKLRDIRWLMVFPVLAALCALLSLWSLPSLASWASNLESDSLYSALLSQSLAVAILTLPATLVFGAWFPVLNRHLAQSTSTTAAKLYGVNSIGAALGTILSGFVFIPWLGSPGTIVFATGVLILCGINWVSKQYRSYYAITSIVLLALALPVLNLPPVSSLLPATQKNTTDLYRFEDAVSITHVIERADGQRLLLGDLQRLDASTEPSAVSSQLEQARLPLLLHPQPHSVLFLGVGTGISARGSLGFPDLDRTGVELSRGAIEAAEQYFTPVNLGVTKQMRMVRDDARRYLRRHDQSFDVIVGDLFHPDLVGRSALLSLQQFERVQARLNPQGIFVQWLALQQFDQENLQVVLRTFSQVFPNAVIFVDGFKLAMIGPADHWAGAPSVLANMNRLDTRTQQLVQGGEGRWTRLGRYFGSIKRHLKTTVGPVQDEWRPYIEYSLPRLRYKNDSSLVSLLMSLMDDRPSVANAAKSLRVSQDDYEQFERSYTATSLATMSWIAGLNGDQHEAHRLIRFANTTNPHDRLISFDLADKMYFSLDQAFAAGVSRKEALQRIISIQENHEAAIRELWRLAIQEGNNEVRDKLRKRLEIISPLAKDKL